MRLSPLTPTLHRSASTEGMYAGTAQFVAARLVAAGGLRGRFRLALAGGSTPRPLYRHLAAGDGLPAVDWSKVDFFFGDERCVPPDHADSNYRMAHETLLGRLPIRPAQVHRIIGEDDPRAAAASYQDELGERPLDLVLLGLGSDGHTASLFPRGRELSEWQARVVSSRNPLQPHRRVSLSLRALVEAREICFLVCGVDKAAVLSKVWTEFGHEQPTLPAAMVRPAGGAVHLFVDPLAAALLPQPPGDAIPDP
ncbi:MAG: 6-phosphogluconolactonase [Deltaproteobacteria bacterium]|nr:6-phosphogluconolactonase [Deltaproteobacteria bacterium]